MVRSGRRVSKRELFSALARAGFEVCPTSKATHFVVRGGKHPVVIATRGKEVLPVYLSRIARALKDGEGDTR